MQTLRSESFYEEEIKKSRFIAKAAPIKTQAEARAFLSRMSEVSASHNCWAYKMENEYRFSDDAEPSGTAGKPILGAIERQQLDFVIVVVTRYFGGIKLGAGGLTRAYGSVAAKCLHKAHKQEIYQWIQMVIRIQFEQLGQLHKLLALYQVIKLEEEYEPLGVRFSIRIKETKHNEFTQAIQDATAGAAQIDYIS